MLTKVRQLFRCKKGQSLVEYGILTGGIALVCLAATAILGHKTNDLIATVAAVLPGAHADDNGAIFSGKLVETASNGTGLALSATAGSIEDNLGIPGIATLVVD
ncbi:MAG: hypothetical protein SFV23_13935 [Planctomycetaceae bacterium]|nr:hypothetical protein [Planctomycetaceae bacterium]